MVVEMDGRGGEGEDMGARTGDGRVEGMEEEEEEEVWRERV